MLKRFSNLLQAGAFPIRKASIPERRPPADLGPLRRNRILARWPSAVLERILPQLELVSLAPGQRLHQPGDQSDQVYFPINATISLGCRIEADRCAEFLQVGCEGLVGMEAFLSGAPTPWEATVRNPGFACRMPVAVLQREFDRSEAVHCVMLHYTASVLGRLAGQDRHAAVGAVQSYDSCISD
jgi:CRP-like cAMP-binding protein